MQKKLLGMAVAAALAVPTVALAQSSVTISGAIQISVDNLKMGSPVATRTTDSETRLNDESSSIIFNIREDLGAGLAGIAKVDVKPNVDSSAIAASGESFLGISSNAFGSVTGGRHNFHFFKAPWDGYGLGGALKLHPTSLIDFAGGGNVAIANATRTANSLKWGSPRWGGFSVDVGYSFNPIGAAVAEADMTAGNTARKGRGLNVNPAFTAPNFQVAYSFWDAKADAPAATLASSDQRSDSVYGYYTMGAFKLGAIWNRTKLEGAAGGIAGAEVSKRDAFSVPVRFTFGNSSLLAHYSVARDDKATALDDGAKMWTLMYAFSFSKRTHMAFALARITNESAGLYDFFTSGGGLGSTNAAVQAGEDPRLISIGLRHSF